MPRKPSTPVVQSLADWLDQVTFHEGVTGNKPRYPTRLQSIPTGHSRNREFALLPNDIGRYFSQKYEQQYAATLGITPQELRALIRLDIMPSIPYIEGAPAFAPHFYAMTVRVPNLSGREDPNTKENPDVEVNKDRDRLLTFKVIAKELTKELGVKFDVDDIKLALEGYEIDHMPNGLMGVMRADIHGYLSHSGGNALITAVRPYYDMYVAYRMFGAPNPFTHNMDQFPAIPPPPPPPARDTYADVRKMQEINKGFPYARNVEQLREELDALKKKLTSGTNPEVTPEECKQLYGMRQQYLLLVTLEDTFKKIYDLSEDKTFRADVILGHMGTVFDNMQITVQQHNKKDAAALSTPLTLDDLTATIKSVEGPTSIPEEGITFLWPRHEIVQLFTAAADIRPSKANLQEQLNQLITAATQHTEAPAIIGYMLKELMEAATQYPEIEATLRQTISTLARSPYAENPSTLAMQEALRQYEQAMNKGPTTLPEKYEQPLPGAKPFRGPFPSP